ncbi:MAG: hypothetical protein AABN33_00775 [Acidobacteriota bacterium]
MIDATRRDFGDVFAGEDLEQSFGVRNAGTKPLELAQKSALGMGSSWPGYSVPTAVWGANDHFIARRVAAMRVAPS